MTCPRALALSALSVVACLGDAVAQGSPSERLAAGEVLVRRVELPGGGPPEIRVEAIIDASPHVVWPIIEDCGRYRHTMPRVAASEELSFRNGVQVCKVTVDAPFPLSDLTAVTRVEVRPGPPVWTRTWTLLSGDYKTNAGSWTLVPEGPGGRRTRVKYRVRVDPDIPVPGAVQAMAQERSLPEMIERIRRQVRR